MVKKYTLELILLEGLLTGTAHWWSLALSLLLYTVAWRMAQAFAALWSQYIFCE